MPRILFASLLLSLFLSACDSDANSFEVTGTWQTFGPVALAGDCCELDLRIRNIDGDLSGSGEVRIPGLDVGEIDEFLVTVTGRFDGASMQLTLTAQQTLTATVNARPAPSGEWYDMVADFDGFGVAASRIPFFRE